MYRRMLLPAVVIALLLPGTASARCAPVSLPRDARQSDFVVEAVLERAGETARFRTTVVWKGGSDAPLHVELGARRGRGMWAWSQPASEGVTFLLFLRRIETGGYAVVRCGATGEADDAQRGALRAQGLRPTPR